MPTLIAAFGEEVSLQTTQDTRDHCRNSLGTGWTVVGLVFSTRGRKEHTVSNRAGCGGVSSYFTDETRRNAGIEICSLGVLENPWSLQDGRVDVDDNPAAPSGFMPMVNHFTAWLFWYRVSLCSLVVVQCTCVHTPSIIKQLGRRLGRWLDDV